MNPFVQSHNHLIQHWKEMRNTLYSYTLEEQLDIVSNFWAKAPLMKMAYDPETLSEYPSPWEMMSDNNWCENSVAVGMDFTLRLGGISEDRLKIKMIRDFENSIQKLVLFVDDKYILNYEYNTVLTEIPKHDVLATWMYNGRKYLEQ